MILWLKASFLQSLKCSNLGDGQSTSVKVIRVFAGVHDQFPITNSSPIKVFIVMLRTRVAAVQKAAEEDPERMMRPRSSHQFFFKQNCKTSCCPFSSLIVP